MSICAAWACALRTIWIAFSPGIAMPVCSPSSSGCGPRQCSRKSLRRPSPPRRSLSPLCARDVETLGLLWPGPECVRAAHGGSTRRACSPSVIDLVRRPHHQGGDLGGISPAIQSLAIDKAQGFALRLAVTVQQFTGLVDLVGLGPMMRQYADHRSLYEVRSTSTWSEMTRRHVEAVRTRPLKRVHRDHARS